MDRLNSALKSMVRGDTYVIKVNVNDALGDPVNLEGRSIYFTMKRSLQDLDETAVVQVSRVLSGAEAQAGVASVTIYPQHTANLEATSYWYDIQMITDQQDVRTLLRGRIPVELDVTRTVDVVELSGVNIVGTYTYSDFSVEA